MIKYFFKRREKIIGRLLKDISEKSHKEYILKFQDGSILEVQETCYETDILIAFE